MRWQGSLGEGKLLVFAPVPDNDRLAGCVLHCSRQAINLSGPASLEIPALRLRRKKKKEEEEGSVEQPEMLFSKHSSELIMQHRLLLISSVRCWCRVQR